MNREGLAWLALVGCFAIAACLDMPEIDAPRGPSDAAGWAIISCEASGPSRLECACRYLEPGECYGWDDGYSVCNDATLDGEPFDTCEETP